MVRHIVAWSFAEGHTAEENRKNAEIIKRELENLKGQIKGIISIEVLIHPLSSSGSDLMLDCVLENEDALKAYQVNPAHLRVANTFVRPVTCNRKCIDFNL